MATSEKPSVRIVSGARTVRDSDTIFSLQVPNSLLLAWYSEVQDGTAPSYIEQLNSVIQDSAVAIDVHCERLERRIARRAGSTARSRIRGGARVKQLQGTSTFDVREGETVSVSQTLLELDQTMEEAGEWRKKCCDAEAFVLDLKQKLQEHLRQRPSPPHSGRISAEPSSSQQHNQQSRSSVGQGQAGLTRDELVNVGQPYSEVSARQKRRKLSQVKTAVEKALWFMGSFGLQLQSVSVKPVPSPLPSPPLSTTSSTNSVCADDRVIDLRFQSEEEVDKSSVRQTLYLLDRFGVSDEFYHELSMRFPTLPRSYIVKSARQLLSETVELERLDPPYYGAYRSFEETLKSALLYEMPSSSGTVTVKLSGDGAQFSRTSQFVLLSFSLPDNSDDALSSYGNHTFAAIKSGENYTLLAEGLKPVFDEMNKVIAAGKVVVDGVDVPLMFILGSDYKFLLLLMGMNAAHAGYACLWCTVHKDKRWDMSIAEHQLQLRSLKHLKDNVESQELGVINQPLLNIELDHVVVDELHLLLRITDRLIDNLVIRAAELDHKNKVHHQTDDAANITKLQETIKSCGIYFKIWLPQKEGRKVYEWSPINGKARLILLEKLPPHIPELTQGEAATSVQRLWMDFLTIYKIVTSRRPTTAEVQSLHDKCKDWVRLFVSIGRHYEGYTRKSVTPYMHILVFHVPQMIQKYGNIKKFSGQGVEKNNDQAKKNYFSSNKHDGAGEILKTEARITQLHRGTAESQSCKRLKRSYTKGVA